MADNPRGGPAGKLVALQVEDGIESIFAEAAEEAAGGESEVTDNPGVGAGDGEPESDSDELDDVVDDIESDTPEDDGPDSDDVDDDEFSWDEIVDRYGERTVKVKVQGELVEVPLRDLTDGFMRREDYSRKTAEVAEVRKAAEWAKDIQEAFANDPVGTLDAFARAYGVDGQVSASRDESDPYEDFDPEIAEVLRQRDEMLLQQQQQLAQLAEAYQSIEQERLFSQVKAEVESLRSEFGDKLDHVEMLRIAAEYNMPLREAAESLVGRKAYLEMQENARVGSAASAVGARKSDGVRRDAKKRAAATSTKKFSASEVSVDDFDDIGELFAITASSMT